MSSKLSLCNLALIKLGKEPVTDFVTTKEGARASLLFDEIQDAVMAEGAWTSTIARAELAALSDAPVFEYDYAYQLPTDCLKVLSVDELSQGAVKFRIEGRTLVTNDTDIKIKYVSRVDDVGSWDEYLKQAMVLRLAAELSYLFRADKALTQSLFAGYRQIVADGLANDGSQGTNDSFSSDAATEVRS